MSTFILKYIQKPNYYLRACNNQQGFLNTRLKKVQKSSPSTVIMGMALKENGILELNSTGQNF